MAISRLLLPNPGLHFRHREFLNSRRFFTSSPPSLSCSSDGFDKSSHLANKEAAKEDRAAAAESKDIREHLGKVGGSWVREIITNLNLLRIPAGKCNKDNTSNSVVSLKVPEVDMIQDDPHGCQGLQNGSQLGTNYTEELESVSTCSTSVNAGQNATEDEVQMETSKDIKIGKPAFNFNVFKPKKEIQSSDGCEDGTLTVLLLDVIREDSLENAVDVKDSETVKLHEGRISSELVNSQSAIDYSGAVMKSENNKRGVSRTPVSAMVMEVTSLAVDNREKVSSGPEKVNPKKQYRQHEEVMSGLTAASGIDQMSGTEDLSPLKPELINETSRTHPKDGNQLNSRAHENHQIDRQASIYIQGPESNTKVKKRLAQSYSSLDLNVADAYALLTKLNGPMVEANSKLDKTVVPCESPAKGKKGLQKLDVKDLVQHVKVFCGEQSTTRTFRNGNSSSVGLFEDTRSMGRIQAQARVQSSEVKIRQTSSKDHATTKEYKKVLEKPNSKTRAQSLTESNENGERMGININDHTQSKPDGDSAVQSCSKELKRSTSSSMEEESGRYKVLVRYLKKHAKKDAIIQLFGSCGAIVSVEEIFFSKASKFKDALVQFKKMKGYMNALKKTDLTLEKEDVFVQPACSLEETTDTISIPELIGDPEAPVAQLKNPLKTVKVTQSSEISIQQLQDALAFCRSSITNIILGSSCSVAYVEFETEDAKEVAIAKHSINIPGKQFQIFRIDAPMTTVARISNTTLMEVQSVCKSYGEIKCIKCRGSGIIDVHFKLAEWHNMLHIFNRLNGIEVDGKKWVVQPAPVFPVGILHVLWSQPEGRRYLRSRAYSLLRKIQKPLDTSELSGLAAYYGCQ